MNVFDEFQQRGMVHTATDGLQELLGKEAVTAYIGFDPTAASLHVGSLLPIMSLARFQRGGHHPIALAGGGTGLIGDPSGKSQERSMLSKEQIEENLVGISAQLSHFLDFDAKTNPARMVNNADWLTTITLTDFLRDIGKYFTVNYMLDKESVKKRLAQEEGISVTEFSYMLLQAYDFLVLYDRYKCVLQMGGSDQWGNITAGTDLIRRLRSGKGHALVFPLITTASGVKFGKTEAGTVWLDAKLTSPFRFYQFWYNTDDKDVLSYLKFFTFLSMSEIDELAAALAAAPEKREAQKRLAVEVTQTVHGVSELRKAEQASQVLFGAAITDVSAGDIADIFSDVPATQVEKEKLSGDGMLLTELLVQCGMTPSRGEAKRVIENGGIYVNNIRAGDIKQTVSLAQTIDGQFVVLRKGQRQYHLVRILGE